MHFNFIMLLGERLKKAREDANLTLKEVGGLSRIPEKHLQSLEQGEHAKLPAFVYTQGFLKKYAEILGLRADDFLKEYSEEISSIKSQNQVASLPELKSPRLVVTPKLLSLAAIGLVVFAVSGYIGYQLYFLLSAPSLVLLYPAQDLTISRSSIEISGRTDVSARLTFNGQQVYIDRDGNFKQEVNLSPGVNKLKIEAVNRFGKKSEITRQVVVEEQNQLK